MLGAIYAHLVIDVWPNGPENEPPLALPIAVLLGAAYVAWRGPGRWSFDRRYHRRYGGATSPIVRTSSGRGDGPATEVGADFQSC